jgi:anti-sigma factor RsiW
MSELLVSPPCEAARPELNAYVDGELAPEDRAVIERHLAGCAACRAEVELLRLVMHALRQAPRPEPSEAMRQRLLAQAAPEVPPQRMEILCVERHGDRVIRRQEVRMSREAGISPGLRPTAAPGVGRVIQHFRRVLSDRSNCYQVIESYCRAD